MLLLLAALGIARPVAAQIPGPLPIHPADAAATVLAGAVYLAPFVFDWNDHPPSCAPCNQADVPGIDRWTIRTPGGQWGNVSTVLVVGLAGATWADDWSAGAPGRARIVASIDATSWAVAATEIVKVVVARKRPVLYTAGANLAASDLDNQRSFPSEHAATAFALATSYALDRGALGRGKSRAIIAVTAAAAVAALRVVAGRHFPTDVAAGAAIGVTSAVVVHAIKF